MPDALHSQPNSALRRVLGSSWAPIAVAVVVRMAFLLAGWGRFFAGDASGYERLGDIWRLDGVYVGAWPPGVAWVIATVGNLFGHDAGMDVIRAGLVVTSAVICYCLMALARRLAGRRAACTAGWLYALHLPLVPSAHIVVSEQLQTALILPALLLVWGLVRTHGWRMCGQASLAGALLGLAGLVRESVILVLPGLVLWFFWRAGPRRGLLASGYLGLSLLVVALPWATRNLHSTGRASIFGQSAGGIVAAGMNGFEPKFDVEDLRHRSETLPMGGLRNWLLEDPPQPWKALRTGAHSIRSSDNIRQGFAFAFAEPSWFVRTRVLQQARAWSPLSMMVEYLRTESYGWPFDVRAVRGPLGILALLQTTLLMAAACLGWERMSRARGARLLLLAVLASYAASSLVLALTRYRVLLDTVLFIPAAVWLHERHARTISKATQAVLICLLLLWIIELPWVIASVESLWSPN